MPTPDRLIALRPLRHECHLCGTCCQGWNVNLVSPEEIALAKQQAAELGIESAVDEEKKILGHDDKGRCVFLSHESRCRIHERWGMDAKPLVCRQYPRRATHTEDGMRIGVDPTCTSSDRSWRDGPELEPFRGNVGVLRNQIEIEGDLKQSENALLALLMNPDMTFPRFISIITRASTVDDELPIAFVGRAIACLRVADLSPLFEAHELGPDLLYRVAAMAELLRGLDPVDPPPWMGLGPARDAFALEVMRRHLFLRLGDPTLPPIAQALLVSLGILVAAWSDPIGDYFGSSLAAWMRMIRMSVVWSRIMPETETARWLLSGDDAPVVPEHA